MSDGEARLGDDVVAELERDPVGDERVVPVRDVRERAAVDERGLPLERLHEVRLDRVLQEHGHRARGADLLRGHGLAVVRLPDRDLPEPLAEIGEVAGDGDERHDLARGGDVEPRLPRVAVRAAAERRDDVAERAVVHVHAAPPGDRERIEAERVPVQDVRVDERGEEVVRGRDRVQVAGEVEVQVLHRDDLRVAAAGRASLHAEDRAERGLAQAEHGLPSEHAEPLRQRDRRRRLPLARRGRRDRRDVDQLRVRPVREPLERPEVDLRLVAPVRLHLVRQQACFLGDLQDRTKRRVLGDLEARRCLGLHGSPWSVSGSRPRRPARTRACRCGSAPGRRER